MKNLVAFVFTLVIISACQKEKQPSIVGVWKEISVYSPDNSGNHYWSETPPFPYILTLAADGTYAGWQCTPTDRGHYRYDPAKRQIELESIPSATVETISVSLLDDDYLILDYGVTSLGEFKVKFIRAQY